jgi:hypothetical protein
MAAPWNRLGTTCVEWAGIRRNGVNNFQRGEAESVLTGTAIPAPNRVAMQKGESSSLFIRSLRDFHVQFQELDVAVAVHELPEPLLPKLGSRVRVPSSETTRSSGFSIAGQGFSARGSALTGNSVCKECNAGD